MSTIFNTKAWAFSFAGQGGEENIRNALTTAKSWTAVQVGRVLRSRKFQCTNTPNALTQTLPFEVIIPIIIMIDPTVAMVAALPSVPLFTYRTSAGKRFSIIKCERLYIKRSDTTTRSVKPT